MRNPFLSAAIVATLGISVHCYAERSPATQPDLQQQVNDLKAEVAQLKSERQSDHQQLQNQADVTKAIQSVLTDVDTHTKTLDANSDNLTAGYVSKRFFIQSEDGDFVLKPWIHIQVRDSTAWRKDGKNGGADDDTQNGLELRRARLGFDGNLFGKDLTYFINWATFRGNSTLTVKNGSSTVGTTTSPVGGLPVLEEAWAKYHIPDTAFYIKVGQMHDPLDHENIVGSKYRAPEASLQGDVFGNTDTFTQAATLIYDNKGMLRMEGGVNDGIRAANTNFEDFPNNGILYAGGVAGRVELKLFGDWKDYDQLTAYNDSNDILVLGAAADDSWGGNFNSLSHVADLSYGTKSGFYTYLAYFGRYTEHNPGIPSGAPVSTAFGSTSDLGKDTYEPSVDLLVSQMLDQHLEPFVRYEYMHLAGTPAGSNNNVTDISLGANYYFHGHNVKATGMITYLPTGIPVNNDSSDVLISNNKGEVVFIAQLQLLL